MKFFFGLLAFIAAVVVVILLIVSLARGLGDGGRNTTISTTYSFDDPSAIDSTVSYRVSGPVVANENFTQVVITISKTSRKIDVLKTYSNTVTATQTLPNTKEAYSAFIGALEAADFSAKKDGVSQDPNSTCVSGNKAFYNLDIKGTDKVDTWRSSCSTRDGDFAGNTGIDRIFRNQIPNYSEFTNGLNVPSI